MPIEFHCRQCNKLLRVGDEHAGKNAQCPECLAVQPVPDAGAAAGGGRGAAGGPSGGAGAPGAGTPVGETAVGGASNPYASPSMAGGFQQTPSAAYGARTGPPWERDGASVGSLIATVKESLAQPVAFFSQMRREGGFGAPIGFAIACSYFGFIMGMIWQLGLQALMMALSGGRGAEEQLVLTAMVFGGGLVCLPVMAIFQLFLFGGLYHVMLIMLGGANQPYEATVRTLAYTQGVVNLCLVIPICGQYASGIVGIVYLIIGLCHVHETSGGKAAAAVLLPAGICCALVVGAIVLLIAAEQGGF